MHSYFKSAALSHVKPTLPAFRIAKYKVYYNTPIVTSYVKE